MFSALAVTGRRVLQLRATKLPGGRGWRRFPETTFELLGVRPALGRLITDADARAPGVEANAVISYALWRDRFGLDPGIVGRGIKLEDRAFTIVERCTSKFQRPRQGRAGRRLDAGDDARR